MYISGGLELTARPRPIFCYESDTVNFQRGQLTRQSRRNTTRTSAKPHCHPSRQSPPSRMSTCKAHDQHSVHSVSLATESAPCPADCNTASAQCWPRRRHEVPRILSSNNYSIRPSLSCRDYMATRASRPLVKTPTWLPCPSSSLPPQNTPTQSSSSTAEGTWPKTLSPRWNTPRALGARRSRKYSPPSDGSSPRPASAPPSHSAGTRSRSGSTFGTSPTSRSGRRCKYSG